MKTKIALIAGLGLMILAQLAVPSKMIWDQVSVTTEGEAFNFRTEPVDPTDPFRGKYIVLSFQDNTVLTDSTEYWTYDETAYAEIGTDDEGFAIVTALHKQAPSGTENYIQVSIMSHYGNGEVEIRFPFNRFYMEESKAYDAEMIYRESQWDEEQETYAIVYIKNGKAVLDDVVIDGVPIKEVVETQ